MSTGLKTHSGLTASQADGDWVLPTYDVDNVVRYKTQVYQLMRGKCTVLAATGNHTLTAADAGLVFIPNTGAKTLTLPAAASSLGVMYHFYKTTADAEIVTLDANSTELINGSQTNTSIDAQYDNILICCNGSAWYILHSSIA